MIETMTGVLASGAALVLLAIDAAMPKEGPARTTLMAAQRRLREGGSDWHLR
ncbi:MAG: hypothetical protein JO060_03140 [Candidatus Eremiobacteraeota bacterium]|nr:hypothetical protein [Candidatus Eremiobacteraeota bacterium]MBV9648366.1 hypothetical protein [Candidatus Eremiobacteraeota bacterium]